MNTYIVNLATCPQGQTSWRNRHAVVEVRAPRLALAVRGAARHFRKIDKKNTDGRHIYLWGVRKTSKEDETC